MKKHTDCGDGIEPASKRRRRDQAEGGSTWSLGLTTQDLSHHYSHNYNSTVVSGRAQAHFGDKISHNYFNGNGSQPDKYESLVRSLQFDRMDTRLLNIATALPKTCQWVFRHKQFAAWLDNRKAKDHHGFLWIKGKPGCGKSTIMKTVLEWAKKKWPNHVILSYFFNARASGMLEKSSLGLYRSLVRQILDRLPDLKAAFLNKFSSKERDGLVEEWTAAELKEFLIEVMTSSEAPQLGLFVDALDEGDKNDIRQMIAFFEDLTHHATDAHAQLRICLSSRHFPHITIHKGLSVDIEEQSEHDLDIAVYVQSKLHGDQSSEMHDLRQEVCIKSMGVFLWVVLVVPMLNDTYDAGGSLEATREHLKRIPPELDALFTEILAKSTEDIEESVSLLQWVLFSVRPLSATELYLAIHYSCMPSQRIEACIPDTNRIAKRLLHCSRGLVEKTAAKPPTMQFIHETVRDFLIARKGLGQFLPQSSANIEGFSHETLKTACLQCIKCSGLPTLNNQRATGKGRTPVSSLRGNFPFLEYAATNLFRHADIAQRHRVCQKEFLASIRSNTDVALLEWVRLQNAFERFAIRKYAENVSLLYIATELNLISIVHCLLEEGVDVNTRGGRYGNALQAACVAGHEEIVQLLLEKGASVNASGGEHKHALAAAIHNKNMRTVALLLNYSASLSAETLAKVLQKTVTRGYIQGVQVLVATGADMITQETKAKMLQLACRRGHEQVMNVLLDNGADINTLEVVGNLLADASRRGYEKVVQMLLGKGTDVNAQGGYYGNALQAASHWNHEKVVQVLLDRGADVNAQGGEYGNALQAASYWSHEKVVQMLLDRGADVNAQGGYYGNALRAASYPGREKVMQMLLERGAMAL